MDFKSKLEALPRSHPGAHSGAEQLRALRARMAEILDRTPTPKVAPVVQGSEVELPFVLEERGGGVLWRRLQRLPASSHLGRAPLVAAREASAGMLALLALDPALGSCEPGEALFLDTETTGLAGSGTLAFLVGLSFFDQDGDLVIEQLLLRSPSDEAELLQHLKNRIESASLLVSYNGKSFDLPLLRERYVMNRMQAPDEPPHLDLLHVGRRLHKERLGQCRLVSLESGVLGFERGDDVEGAEIALRYGHYLRSGDVSGLVAVVQHNAWDVMSMAALMGLYGEPMTSLCAEDLVGLAKTFKRAGALSEAGVAADAAVQRGVGERALHVRGQVHKARGDRARALADFEALCELVDDPGVRLELCKLYEHHVKAHDKALKLLAQGTGESEEGVQRRRQRLIGKYRKSQGVEPKPPR